MARFTDKTGKDNKVREVERQNERIKIFRYTQNKICQMYFYFQSKPNAGHSRASDFDNGDIFRSLIHQQNEYHHC